MPKNQWEGCDGEYYCKIREYQGVHGEPNPYLEGVWLDRLKALGQNRRDLFDQLSRHTVYLAAFDALLIIPALFYGFRLTVIHHLIAMRCEEVIIELPVLTTHHMSLTEESLA